MIGRLARTVVPDILYLEYKSLYLELKPSVAATSAALPAAAVAGLMAIIWKTESVYWINGTSFEQARDAGSDRRREFAAAHLRVFGRFALGYVVFSAIMQWRGVTWGVDLAVFCVGLIGAAIGTLKVKL